MPAQGPPNIVTIMADDIGWFNIGAYHQGIMASRTPNLDRLAAEGMRFTDYYAEASCTAGRANFITGELPIRTGLTTVGQAGAKVGMPAEAPTIATALRFPSSRVNDRLLLIVGLSEGAVDRCCSISKPMKVVASSATSYPIHFRVRHPCG